MIKKSSETYELRKANQDDCQLMFRLQNLNGADLDHEDSEQVKKFEDYKKNFKPKKIDVIYFENRPVGRLRIVRGEDLYIGGFQILPELRGKGIGTSILKDLINEAKRNFVDVRLEVFHENILAKKLYKRLGFEVVEENENQKVMVLKNSLHISK